MIAVLFWDVDGTLLTTNRAGVFAWEEAVRTCIRRRCDLQSFPTAGLTDHEIGRALLRHVGAGPDVSLDAVVRCYEALLPTSLGRRAGRVLPGVLNLLEAARKRPDVRSFLLTGNTGRGAAAKLEHYGLVGYFPDGGAFSDDAPDRPGIARVALDRARRALGDGTAVDPVVIGDTPHDIRCGHAIGARVLAVATGAYALPDLEAHGAWWTVAELPSPAEFFARLGVRAGLPT